MSKLLDIIKTAWYVHFEECRDGALWYAVTFGETFSGAPPTNQFRFHIPLEDVAGAVFPAIDDNPKFYMRWIRKQLEADEAAAALIKQAKADWEKEQNEV